MNRIGEALCAALREGSAGASHIDLAALTPAEWHDVAALAIQQRVGPLLYSQEGLPMPDDVRARLRARAKTSARRVLMQLAAFRELADAVAPLGISLIALKGIHLATSVYRSAGLREMNDIDVLVSPTELAASRDAAHALGYAEPTLVGLCGHHLPPLIRGGLAIEIHWALTEPNVGVSIDVESVRGRATHLTGPAGAQGLCMVDLLLHTSLHAAEQHLFAMGIRPLCDVRAIIDHARGDLDWIAVIRRSREWRTERGLALVLTLAHRLLGVQIPETVWTELRFAKPTPELVDAASDFLFGDSSHLAGSSEASRALLSLPNTRARLAHIAESLLQRSTPRDPQDPHLHGLRRLPPILKRGYGLVRRHGRWLWRASQDRNGAMQAASRKSDALADWVRNR